jgi:ribosomal protein S18 acetylase RimI-like enzyme
VKLKLLSPDEWLQGRNRLTQFAIRFGDKRLTAATLRTLRQLEPARLTDDGDAAVVIATQDGRTVGFGLAAGMGEECCMVVVHPEARSLGIGGAIVQAMIKQFGELTCMVAADNTASMALCFRLGMAAVSMHRGPTGKPTLRFERRNVHDTARLGHSDFISQ